MSKILLTIQIAQDVEDDLNSDRTLGRQFWIRTTTDLAYALDTVETEARGMFEFEKTGIAATFNKDNVRTHLEEDNE